MKKQFLLLGLAVAAMTSCTNDEVLDVQQPVQKAIGFDSFVNKGTRAVVEVDNEVTAGNLARYYVYGYYDGDGSTEVPVFNNACVYNDPTLGWTIDVEKFWETKFYHFAAYADGQGEGADADPVLTPSFSNETLTFDNYTVNTTRANQTDLIADVTYRNNTSNFNTGLVDLNFKHLLSKVDFKFSNTNDQVRKSNLSMVISNVKLAVYNVADCEFDGTTPTWEFADNVQEVVYDIDQPVYDDGNNTNDETKFGGDKALKDTQLQYIIPSGQESDVSLEYFVIPSQENAEIRFTVTYYDNEGNQVETYNKAISLFPVIDVINGTKITWTPSYIYKYDVNLPASPKQIEFNVKGVGNWTSTEVSLDGSNN